MLSGQLFTSRIKLRMVRAVNLLRAQEKRSSSRPINVCKRITGGSALNLLHLFALADYERSHR